jgi:hypothetical protein
MGGDNFRVLERQMRAENSQFSDMKLAELQKISIGEPGALKLQ